MNLAQFLDFLKQEKRFADCISGSFTLPAAEPKYAPLPAGLDEKLTGVLKETGVGKLYTHQSLAIEAALRGENTVVVTPTASGKSLTYTLPIFQRKLQNPHSRSLLLFPTKALAQDQLASLNRFSDRLNKGIKIFTYDGDTPPAARRKIMEAGDFVVSNPDMLHSGILPMHTNWIKLFENLEFIVMDELHVYRGVFGSHVANLLRRLLRICEFYGSTPRFLASSATIGNPLELAEKLTGRSFTLIDQNGAPRAEKSVVFYNPPVVNKSLGIRASALKETAYLGSYLLKNKISTIFFCRSRLRVELLFTYLRERVPELVDRIRAYRGGYLPGERRKIEKELREGQALGVVSTNALELGIDIGLLDVSVTMGYPGSIGSLLQQFGRAGRRGNVSLSVLVATSDGTDQYLASHPDYFLSKNPENAMIHPDNLLILSDHLKCAAYELPFADDENFGSFLATSEILEHLSSNGVLNHSGGKYHWMSDVYPANTFSLRSGPRENFVIIDVTEKNNEKVIGEIDLYGAPTMIHTDAIYLHQGIQYYVEELMWDERQARVRRINEDYYTDAQEKVDTQVLEIEDVRKLSGCELVRGELMLRIKAVMFKKIKLETHENLGWGEIHTPELEMHTQGGWILIPESHSYRTRISDRELGSILSGTAYAMSIIAPLFIMCDPGDVKFRSEVRSTAFKSPALYFYDAFPGGLELSYRIMQNLETILESAKTLVQECSCERGCPSCVGAPDEEIDVRAGSIQFLLELIGNLSRAGNPDESSDRKETPGLHAV